MKNLSKKQWIITGSISVPVLAFAVAIPIAISQKDHDQSFSVNISSADDARYVLSQLDPSQNKGKETDASMRIWDTYDADGAKDTIALALGITEESQVQITIDEDGDYKSGLDKLMYDLLDVEDNGPELILILSGQDSNGDDYKQLFDTNFITGTMQERQTKLLALAADPASGFYQGIIATNFVNHNNGSTSIAPTTPQQIVGSINNMYAAHQS